MIPIVDLFVHVTTIGNLPKEVHGEKIAVICDNNRINHLICDNNRINHLICDNNRINHLICDNNRINHINL